jgi:hypothetical protein
MFRRGAAALILSTLVLTGCFTGERPYFNDEPFPTGAMTGNAEVDAVLGRLDAVTAGPVTAAYSVLTKFGNVTNPAVVILDGGARSVTIGNVRYIETPTGAATCTEDGSLPCSQELEPSRVSNIGVTIDFYAAEAATRLRRDFRAAIAPPTGRTDIIAEQSVTCVDVPLPGGVAVYCVLDNGIVARLDDGDVAVNLTLFGELADATKLTLPTG